MEMWGDVGRCGEMCGDVESGPITDAHVLAERALRLRDGESGLERVEQLLEEGLMRAPVVSRHLAREQGRLLHFGPAGGELLRPRQSLPAAEAALRGAQARPEPPDGPGRPRGRGRQTGWRPLFNQRRHRARLAPRCLGTRLEAREQRVPKGDGLVVPGGGKRSLVEFWGGRRRAAEPPQASEAFRR